MPRTDLSLSCVVESERESGSMMITARSAVSESDVSLAGSVWSI